MDNTFKTLFLKAKEPEFPASLHAHIMEAVRAAAIRQARLRAAAWSAVAFLSGAGLVPVFAYVMQMFAHSGFFQYFSLVFSDGGTVLSLWQEFAVLLSETFPFAQAAAFLALVIVCLVSLRAAARSLPLALGRATLARSY